jgi:hypothetical protein
MSKLIGPSAIEQIVFGLNNYIDLNVTISDATELENILNNYIDDIPAFLRKHGINGDVDPIENFMDAYKRLAPLSISDETLKKLLNIINTYGITESYFDMLSGNMTVKQLEFYMKDISVTTYISDPRITIDKIVTRCGSSGGVDILNMSSRFFTEEDMIKHPQLFNPETLINQSRMYCSKSTFKILNKVWGTRKRWSDELISANMLFRRLPNNYINKTVVEYIVKKTNTSNTELIDLLEYVSSQKTSEYIIKIHAFNKFTQKYKG